MSLPLDRRLRFWQAPLVPVALAYTAGVGLDHLTPVHFPLFLILAAISLGFWLRRPDQGLVFLWLGTFLFGAAYHHFRLRFQPADSLARHVLLDGKPVRVQGRVLADPQRRLPPAASSLRTFPPGHRASFLLGCTAVMQSSEAIPASGVVQVWLEGRGELPGLGDQVEVGGIVHHPGPPSNPGGLDRETQLRSQGVVAVLDSDFAALRMLEGSSLAYLPHVVISWLRQEARGLLERYVPQEQQGLAIALLLGDGSALTTEDWDIYLRTGVIHVLAISGQHLVLLAAFLAFFARLGHVSRRRAGPFLVVFLFVYALITGGRPPVMRAAWMVLAWALAWQVRRPVLAANVFALAWILVGLWQPGDLFQTGCLLSFLAVAVLIWGTPSRPEDDPVQQLLIEQRPVWLNLFLQLASWKGTIYLSNAIVWMAVTPLVASRLNIVSPIALLIGPLMVLGTSLALLTGFLTLLLGPLLSPLGSLFGLLTGWSLALCQWIVALGDAMPAAYHFVADLSPAWLLVFYLGLFAFLTLPFLRSRARLYWTGCVLWLLLGWGIQSWPRAASGEFRCTFLAVGHGGCTVIENPDGAVFLYDAGAMAGPEVTRQHIAPFLWQRGIRQLDEVFISHADLDHFNGVPALLDRFRVGRVNLTPSFEQRSSPAVALTLDAFRRRQVPTRILSAGDRLRLPETTFDVLHPPREGPEGNENARSLVLLVRHESLSLLLTGDLEGQGLERMLHQPAYAVDVLMAPHHGSRLSNTPRFAQWAGPRFVVSCQGRPRSTGHPDYPGARYLTTWEHGAITVRSFQRRNRVETFRTGRAWDLD